MAAAKDRTTVWVPTDLRDRLEDRKLYKNEPYFSVILRLLDGGGR